MMSFMTENEKATHGPDREEWFARFHQKHSYLHMNHSGGSNLHLSSGVL